MSATAFALTGFISWALGLLIVMEVIRTYLVISGKVAANGFTPDNAALSPFMQRLARAHANCIEGLPIFGGLLGVAILISKTDVTDPLASTLLAARIVQSIIHLVSTSQVAVSLRFTAFTVQMVIGAYWSWAMLR
ncbi:MAPEG family protein (plasmid) [Mesorhizobium loti]|uniref:MAPEG family protein n=1 Tax=Mesorhizobium jarvisii TaxID=1777867 RepID=A0A6M7TR66_9HYPH|nr:MULTISPECIES: MAPEG family protein [Mesorhizobium]ANN62158.1 MAPEG family protein [Mesorhizobium loti NZP2037]OBQ70211.1 MAPEG family protein [Mesorhizobium loti]QKC67531.1 MAPEG family protein [Mesorhizobium jarvisii]QKD13445.1 MAPEG family protein [Mesorhizobium loti]RJT29555.1 MAPEG family protein [Mesorhizobium jarvisii]